MFVGITGPQKFFQFLGFGILGSMCVRVSTGLVYGENDPRILLWPLCGDQQARQALDISRLCSAHNDTNEFIMIVQNGKKVLAQ